LREKSDPHPMLCDTCGGRPDYEFRRAFDAIPGQAIEHDCSRCGGKVFNFILPHPKETLLSFGKVKKGLLALQWFSGLLSSEDRGTIGKFFEAFPAAIKKAR